MALTLALACAVCSSASAQPPLDKLSPQALRAAVYRMDANLGRIIDREDPTWITTRGYHGSTSTAGSYGLCQANPGTKMISAGAGWRTSATTQIKWCIHYAVSRYGSTAAAWSFWQRNYWW